MDEYESEIKDDAAAKGILEALGLQLIQSIKKYRESYKYKNTLIEIDINEKEFCPFPYIEIESEIGKGTCFKVFFPIKFDQVESNIQYNKELFSLSGHEKILLIEDDKDVRKILSLLPKKSGYNVIESRNGLEGVKYYKDKVIMLRLIIQQAEISFV